MAPQRCVSLALAVALNFLALVSTYAAYEPFWQSNETTEELKMYLDQVQSPREWAQIMQNSSRLGNIVNKALSNNARANNYTTGSKIRIQMIEDGPFCYRRELQDGTIYMDGYLRDLLNQLSNDLGFDYEIVNEQTPPEDDLSYGTALEAAERGDIDLVCAAHWMTYGRLSLNLRYTTGFGNGGIALLALAPSNTDERTFPQKLELFLNPFDGTLWLVISIVVVVTTFLLVLFQAELHEDRKNGRAPSVSDGTDAGEDGATLNQRRFASLKAQFTMSKIIMEFYMVLLAMLQVNWFENPKHAPQTIVLLGLALVSLLFTATYTAGFTAQLAAPPATGTIITDFRDLQVQRMSVCTSPSGTIAAFLNLKYPLIGITSIDNVTHGLDLMNAGECGAVGYDAWILEALAYSHCNYEYLFNTEVRPLSYVFTFSYESPWHYLEPAMSRQIIEYRSATPPDFTMDAMYEKWFLTKNPDYKSITALQNLTANRRQLIGGGAAIGGGAGGAISGAGEIKYDCHGDAISTSVKLEYVLAPVLVYFMVCLFAALLWIYRMCKPLLCAPTRDNRKRK